MAQRAPLDLTNGVKINLGEALSSYNRREYHHVFPRAFLKNRSVLGDRINTLCNFCFLPSGSNKKISHKEPADYIFNLVPQSKRDKILDSNLLPLRMEVYEKNDYERFLHLRAERIAQHIDALVI